MPSNRLRFTLAASLLVALACADGRPAGENPDATAVAGDSATVPPTPVVTAAAPDSAASLGADSAGVQAADSAAPQTADSAASQTAGPAAEPVPAPISAQELTARLDRIAAAQQTLAARIDSLTPPAQAAGSPTQAAGRPVADAQEVLGEAGNQIRNFGLGVFWAILVVFVFNFMVKAGVWVLDALAERSPSRRLFYKKLVPITRILLWIFATYLIVRVIFNVTAQGLLAAGAAVGVAIGFAAQDLLKNLFGGIILVFDQPFQVGDKISVGGTYGEVVSIGLRSTRLVTPDDNLVSVPNAQVVDGQVANANAGELNCQVVTDVYLPGWVDEAKAKRIAFEAAAHSKYLYLNKPIVVLVKDEFKETFLTRIRIKAYVLDPRYEFQFQSDVTERARAGFREAGLLEPGHGLRAYLDLSRVHAVPRSEE